MPTLITRLHRCCPGAMSPREEFPQKVPAAAQNMGRTVRVEGPRGWGSTSSRETKTKPRVASEPLPAAPSLPCSPAFSSAFPTYALCFLPQDLVHPFIYLSVPSSREQYFSSPSHVSGTHKVPNKKGTSPVFRELAVWWGSRSLRDA